MRRSGLDIVGDVPWGTHFCQFYQTPEDLREVLVGYFRQGLEDNEYCMWVTSEPLDAEQARESLRQAVPDLDERIERGQIEFLDYRQWYTLGGRFDSDRVLEGWVQREMAALKRGFAGLRLSGNTFWLEKSDWKGFADYEEAVDRVIGGHRMMALCTYSLERCGAFEIMDVVRNHQFALIKQTGQWELIQSLRHRQTEAALRESESRYRSLFMNMHEGFAYCRMIYDEGGRPSDFVYLAVNDAFGKLTGLRNVVGRKVTEAIPGIGAAHPELFEIYGRVATTGLPEHFEVEFKPLGVWLSVSAYSPGPGYFAAVFDNITQRKRAETALASSMRRLELLAGTAGELLRSHEPQTVVESLCRQVMAHLDCHAFFNFLADRAAGRLRLNACAGIPQEEARRIEWLDYGTDVCGCAARDGCRTVAEHIPTTPDPRTELVKSYGIKAYACHPLLGPGGEVIGTLSFGTRSRETFSDDDLSLMKAVTDHVAVAMVRQRTESELEAARASAEHAKAIAESANRAKDHFIAVLSHELRTPLSPVLMAAAILENDPEFPQRYHDDIATIRRNAELEARLIDDLLDMTRIARGKVQLALQEVGLCDVLARAIETCDHDALEKGVALSLQTQGACGAVVQADPARLQQVFWNLLKNAIKFTSAGGSISVCAATRLDHGQPCVTVSVRDTGVGIAAEHLPRIFEAFEQGGVEVTRRHGGLGLGLAICRSLVEMHGGVIRAASEGAGRGATFTVDLPLHRSGSAGRNPGGGDGSPAAAAPVLAPSGTGRPPCILLVEDHEPTAKTTARLLQGFGYEVRVAHDMATALIEAERRPFDLLVSDLGLPDGSGHELLQRLLKRGPVKAIALSGYGMDSDLARSRQSGFVEHLIKPINFRRLQEAVDRTCRRGAAV